MSTVFISYRREITAGEARALFNELLAKLGRDWADVKDEEGRPRLHNPGDFVRLEIEAALKRDIVVTPILVQGRICPPPSNYPQISGT